MHRKALLVGNSDGIGLASTRRLLSRGWEITGISRSESPISDKNYHHYAADVCESKYSDLLDELLLKSPYDLCIYFVGIGELLDPLTMNDEVKIFDVNLTGMIRTAAKVIPHMAGRKQGHFIGISSFADELYSAEAPSYSASKAGFSNYLGGLALAMKSVGVHITNIRFGFVDTKMAKSDIKPFMMSVEKSVDHIEYCIKKKPVRYSAPKVMIPLIKLRKLMMSLGGK